MVVPVVRSFHTVDELIVCLFLTKQVQRQNVPLCEESLNQRKLSVRYSLTYMCGIGVNKMVDRLNRLCMVDWGRQVQGVRERHLGVW